MTKTEPKKMALTREQIKDWRTRPGFYFHSQKNERLEYAEEVIKNITNQDEWADYREDDAVISAGGKSSPLFEIETIVSGEAYRGYIRMFKGHIGHLQLGVVGVYPNLIFFDFDTEDLRHPAEIENWKGMLCKDLGEAVQGGIELFNEVDPYLNKHAFRFYMTQRGIRIAEVGALYEWTVYPQVVSTLPKVVEGDIKMDYFHLILCTHPNKIAAVTKEEVKPLNFPPTAQVLLDRPSEHLWINAMPFLEIGTPCEGVDRFIKEVHDDICINSMTPERMEFFWSEMRRRLPSVEEGVRKDIIEFLEKNYKEVNL